MPITDAALNTTLATVIDPNTGRDHGSAKRIRNLGGTQGRGEDRAPDQGLLGQVPDHHGVQGHLTRSLDVVPCTDRRHLLAAALSALSPPCVTAGRPQPLLAVLESFGDPDDGSVYRRLAAAQGYRQADALRVVVRAIDRSPDTAAAVARELLVQAPAAFLTIGDLGIRAAMVATRSTPIVAMGYDLVGSGFVQSLREPGGNVTGVSLVAHDLDSKRLELLAQLLPKGSAVLVMGGPEALLRAMPLLQGAAQQLGLSLATAAVSSAPEVKLALQQARRPAAAGVLVLYSDFIVNHIGTLVEACTAARLPVAHPLPEKVEEAGGVIGYGPEFGPSLRQLIGVLIRVLQGEPPARVPVEQPNRYAMSLDQRAARALGIAVPASLRARADRVIG